MARMIFVNLPTRNLAAADAFYSAMGFEKNASFSNDDASSWMISPEIWVMSLSEAYFGGFLRGGDAPAFGEGGKQMLNALSCSSIGEVDELTRTAAAHGGAVYRDPKSDFPGMYGSAVTDPDGHVWELVWMEQPGDGTPTEESGE
ncbi:VOC family protein [Arthrobacter halodurans]|uniref:VOC family protein n=1 Tax=Arthrobacter halodurans TaxID=516699 RepID=A0ABV4UJ28_9MICC